MGPPPWLPSGLRPGLPASADALHLRRLGVEQHEHEHEHERQLQRQLQLEHQQQRQLQRLGQLQLQLELGLPASGPLSLASLAGKAPPLQCDVSRGQGAAMHRLALFPATGGHPARRIDRVLGLDFLPPAGAVRE